MIHPMNNYLLLLFIILFFCTLLPAQQRTCGTMEYMKKQMEEDPNIQNRRAEIEERLRDKQFSSSRSNNSFITIPTVVHIVYNEASENISDAQIFSQMEVLNQDFRRMNADASNTPADFLPVAADIEIEFCLARLDPNGNPTDGITRTFTDQISFGADDRIKATNTGGQDAWDTESYLNIWVSDLGFLLGYAQFPGGNNATDGIVVDHRAFGTVGTVLTPFHLGRTATHEVGHWLNLFHIWGDGPCGLDDAVSDTPLAAEFSNNSAPCTHPNQNTCDEGVGDLPDMFQNYMDFSHDVCMNLFTQGQKSRMRSLFEPGNARASLLESNGCGTVPTELTFTTTNQFSFGDPCRCSDSKNCEINNTYYFHDVMRIPTTGSIASGLDIRVANASNFFIQVPCANTTLQSPSFGANGTSFKEVSTGVYELEFWRTSGILPSLTVLESGAMTTVPAATFQPICSAASCQQLRPINIPTMSEWGKLIFMLLVLNVSLILLRRMDEENYLEHKDF